MIVRQGKLPSEVVAGGRGQPAKSVRCLPLQQKAAGAPERGAPVQAYFWMQVSAVSFVHSSRPVKTGSSTGLPAIRSIMTDGAL